MRVPVTNITILSTRSSLLDNAVKPINYAFSMRYYYHYNKICRALDMHNNVHSYTFYELEYACDDLFCL